MLTGQAEGNDESSPAVLARVKYWIEFFVNTIKDDPVTEIRSLIATSLITGSGYEYKHAELKSEDDVVIDTLRPQPAALSRDPRRKPGASARTAESEVQTRELTAVAPILKLNVDIKIKMRSRVGNGSVFYKSAADNSILI